MQTIDIDSANKQFKGKIQAGEYVVFWISDDNQVSIAMSFDSHPTAEAAIADAKKFGHETELEGGRYEAEIVVE